MLEFTTKGRRIFIGKKVILADENSGTKSANVKHVIFDKKEKEIFIVTDDFLVVCKNAYRSEINSFEKYIFVPLPENGDFLLSYFLLIGVTVFEGPNIMQKIDVIGYTLIKEIDSDGTTTIVD